MKKLSLGLTKHCEKTTDAHLLTVVAWHQQPNAKREVDKDILWKGGEILKNS